MTISNPTLYHAIFAACLLLSTLAPPSRAWGEDVLTQRNNNLRTGVSSWPGLDQSTVKDFQLLASLPVDAPVLAQPLVVQSQNWTDQRRPPVIQRLSVLWIATAANTIYAFNADPPFQLLYKHNLGAAYFPVVGGQLTYLKGPPGQPGFIGIESTPVIDLTSNTMFVSYRTAKGGSRGRQHLTAIDITSGRVMHDVIVPGTDDWYKLHRNRASLMLDNRVIFMAFAGTIEYSGSEKSWQGWIHAFDASSLSHLGDYRTMHTPGKKPKDSLDDTRDGGGIWQASTGLAADSNGNIFFATGNASKDPAPPDPENLSSSVIRLSVARTGHPSGISMKAADWFTPYSKLWLDHHDMDFASAGVVLIPGTHYLVAVGKESILYVLDRNNMGKFDSRPTSECSPDVPLSTGAGSSVPDDKKRDYVVQKFKIATNQYFAAEHRPLRACGNDFHIPRVDPLFDFTQWPHVHGTPVFGDFGHGAAFLYVWPEKDHLQSFHWLGEKFGTDPTSHKIGQALRGEQPLAPPWKHNQRGQVGMPGGMLSLSVDPTKQNAGVLFASLQTCGDGTTWRECSPEVCGKVDDPLCNHQETGMLRAFDPISLKELWNDQGISTAVAGRNYDFAKFVPPTLTKGRAYLATASNGVVVQPGVVGGSVRVYGSLGGIIWQYTGTPCGAKSCPGWIRLDNDDLTMAVAAAGNNLYKLEYDGAIWRYERGLFGNPCRIDSFCPGWRQLDNNRKTVAIAAGGNQLYQMHNNGAIFQSTGGPCNGNFCPGWLPLDNNPSTVAIAAGDGSLFQMHNDGVILQYTGTACQGNSCSGWLPLDENFNTVAIAASGGSLFQMHNDGAIFQYTGTPCLRGSCPGWRLLDKNFGTVGIVAGGGSLYQMHNDGAIFQYTGTPCTGNSCPGWLPLDKNSRTVAIAANGGPLFQMHNDGAIFQYTGTPCGRSSCSGWLLLDNNARTGTIAAGGTQLYQVHADPVYQLHDNGAIWRNVGLGWYKLDNNSASVAIAASGKELFQLHKDGSIWRFIGIPCGANSCPGWEEVDNNAKAVAIAVAGKELFQLHQNGSIWRYLGTPCTNSSCPGWQELDNNPAATAIAAAGRDLFQLHKNGSIWRYLGTPCTNSSCPGWQELDNNPAAVAIAVAGKELFQLHQNGSIWRYLGTPCTNSSCPGWQELDNNPAATAIAAAGRDLFQLHKNGSIWRYVGTPCTNSSCPGWEKLDNNHASVEITAGGKELLQLHKDGSIWHYLGMSCTASSCPGWQQLDNSANAKLIEAGSLQ